MTEYCCIFSIRATSDALAGDAGRGVHAGRGPACPFRRGAVTLRIQRRVGSPARASSAALRSSCPHRRHPDRDEADTFWDPRHRRLRWGGARGPRTSGHPRPLSRGSSSGRWSRSCASPSSTPRWCRPSATTAWATRCPRACEWSAVDARHDLGYEHPEVLAGLRAEPARRGRSWRGRSPRSRSSAAGSTGSSPGWIHRGPSRGSGSRLTSWLPRHGRVRRWCMLSLGDTIPSLGRLGGRVKPVGGLFKWR
jgi:hypothetical protein